MLRIGSLDLDSPLVLAPMAGITDRDFRLILRRIGGVGLVTMEFVSARDVVSGSRIARELLVFDPAEHPLSIQVYGGDPDEMAEAAAIVEALGADACDVNMGCPANKILRGCRGVALMDDLDQARRIVRAIRQRIRIPLTVKFRLGLDEARLAYMELGRICEGEGADAVALHARTAKQRFGGRAGWEHIAQLSDALGIPVLGNGDVTTPDDAVAMLEQTGCGGVMVGRAATRDPWIFQRIAARLAGREAPPPSLGQRRDLVVAHFATVIDREEPGFALHKLKLFTKWYSRGIPGGVALRRQLGGLQEPGAVLAAVESHFAELEAAERADAGERAA